MDNNNKISVFHNEEFGEVRTMVIDNEPWFVGKDVAETLGYGNPRDAVSKHVDDEDKRDGVAIRDSIGREQCPVFINESGLYSLVLKSQLPTAKKFKHWVTSEVLPSIRKTGTYVEPSVSSDYLFLLAESMRQKEQEIARLSTENQIQAEVIADYTPKIQYLDTIINSGDALATTQIAADYGMSANKLNKILHSAGIQRNVNGQWILYHKHMGMGYTKSETISFTHSDGSAGTKVQTKWTQKGRIMIHNILTEKGITALMDRGQ